MKLENQNKILLQANKILESRAKYNTLMVDSPDIVKTLFQTRLCNYEHEVFAVAFLNNRHQLIEVVEMFSGTIDSASVYPREVVKAALKRNAAAVVLAHNHPSGIPTPSQADITITHRLKKALALIDVRVVDHIIVGKTCTSLAETGDI